MNALADEKVGDYLNEHFVSASQKVGTFQIINNAKVGGNVASYFCRIVDDEVHVIHSVPGPVDARTFLSEARYAVELHNQAMLAGAKSWQKYSEAIQAGFQERIAADRNAQMRNPGRVAKPAVGPLQAAVNLTLMRSPLPKLVDFYPYVWKQVLGERLSAAPVAVR